VVIVISFLYFLVVLKLLAMIHAIRWILSHGSEYRAKMSEAPNVTAAERDRILDDCRAGFFPFGVKDYRLSTYMRNPDCKGLKRFTVGLFRKYLFQFPGPAFAGSALLVITANFRSGVTFVDGRAYGWIGAGYGALLLIVIITFSVEAFLSYAILGSYGSAFHRLDVPRERFGIGARGPSDSAGKTGEPIVTEMVAYGGILITGYVAMSSTMYFLSQRLDGFSYIPAAHGTALVAPTSLFDALYWTAIIPADLNGSGPIGAFPRVIVLLAFIAVFVMVTFVVFILGLAMASVRKLPSDSSHPGDNSGEKTHIPRQRKLDADATRALPQGPVPQQRRRRSHKKAR
jgi:hypothetical protein